MKKIMMVLLLAALSVSLFGCAASSLDTNGMQKNEAMFDYAVSDSYDGGMFVKESVAEAPQSVPMEAETVTAATSRKIIYSSWYDIQTRDYDDAVAALHTLCEKYGAYFESSNTYGGMSANTMRSSNYTVRIPVANYNAFLNESATIGTVVRSGENNKDITDSYFDTEARLASAQLREERLLEILANADKLDDVLALERELADVRYEIESFTGTLRKYDGLISYATAEISIEEVARITEVPVEKETLGSRIAKSFRNGWDSFTDDLQDFLVDLTYSLPVLLFIWLPIAVIVIVLICVLRRRKRKKKMMQAAQQPYVEPPKK